MKVTPLVTVVVPTYCRGTYLREAVVSALNQTHQNIELIISDDGSPTSYAEALAAELQDPRIRVRRNSSNLGQAGNNRAAFGEARGEFVSNLHDDDIWEPRFLESLIAPLQRDSSLVLAFSDHWVIDACGRIQQEASDRNSAKWRRTRLAAGRHQPFVNLALLWQSVPIAMACVWRRSAVAFEQMPDEVNAAYDFFLGYLAARGGGAAWYEPERLTRYRIHAQRATAGRSLAWAQSAVNARKIIASDERVAALRPAISRELGVWYTTLAIDLIALGRSGESRTQAWEGLRRAPNARAVAGVILSLLPSRVSRRVISRSRVGLVEAVAAEPSAAP